jgi:hypothetical protein
MLLHPTRFAPFALFALVLSMASCLPPADPYPHRPPADVVAEAEAWSGNFEAYIQQWLAGQASPNIPNALIPKGINDSKNFYLKNPDLVPPEAVWAVRYAKPINKDSLYAGIPDPKITYLFLGTALAPFGSKLVVEGEFPHCRFFSIQITPPLNGSEYYAQRQFGAAEVALVDADIEPLPGHTNPFRVGANRNATQRGYRVEFDLRTGDPTALNPLAHTYPFRANTNTRNGAMLVYQGPLGHKTVAGTPLAVPGDWNLGALWVRIYEPDDNKDALGGVAMPKVWFELPNGQRYFVGSDFSELQKRADVTIANRVVNTQPNPNYGPGIGWYKSWEISRNILNGICLSNGWSRIDSGARVRDIALGWTGRGEAQPSPSARLEPHATTNNYISYVGRGMTVPPGMVAVLTGKLPTFPSTRNGEATMTGGEVRYWSICGIDADPLSPLPATTVHAIVDDDVATDTKRNYMIAYSRPGDRPANATAANGVSWVDWGTQNELGLLMRWLCVAPDWRFSLAPQEHNLDFAHSDWSGTQYDSTLLEVNWRHGFMQCYLPRVHYMSKAEFEALGSDLSAEKIPVWVDETYKIGPSEALLGTVAASSLLDDMPANAASNANDGNYNTAWSSAFAQQTATITADLGSPKVVSAVKLYWDFIFFAKNYTVEVSDDAATWAVIATATDENGQIDLYKNLKNVKARYVRLNLTQPNTLWYRLGEFEVYSNDCDCEAPPSVATQLPHVPSPKLHIFPNPATDFLSFEVQGVAPKDIQILDLSGRVQPLSTLGNGKIDLRGLSAGTYILRVRDSQGRSATGKFLVLR